MKRHLPYPDICKFIAIFLVTWSHCAQCISGRIWTNLWGGGQIDIAFNMPLFMLISGWFINLERTRETTFINYFNKKFKRLIIPSATCFFIHTMLSFKIPELTISGFYWYFIAMLNYYWYLTALFICLIVINIFAKAFHKDYLCIITSTIIVLICPISNIANVNFMFPFIWVGYGLNKILSSKFSHRFIYLCVFIGGGLCFYWEPKYSVYVSPLLILNVTWDMFFIYIYRFSIGACISSIIIYIVKRKELKLYKLSKLGSYSLAIYTMSIIILDIFSHFLNKTGFHTNEYIVIDLLSLFLCIAIIYIVIIFTNYCRNYRKLKILFLGE